jgi:outer membrane receptor protein involved in Fe transport
LLSELLLLAATSGVTPSDTLVVPFPEVVVSATRAPAHAVEIPKSTSIVTGEELKRRGAHNLAEALQDVPGLDTGEGSDNGSRLPNVGMWGLKEFDALLFTYDGVPVGGPFNPSLSQISIDDIDRVEIVKGPQGTLYGVSAFAGMVQVFSRASEKARGHVTGGGGSFTSGNGSFGWSTPLSPRSDLHLTGVFNHGDGWQDRTEYNVARGGIGLGTSLGKGRMTLDLTGYGDRQEWGTPMPFESGQPVEELSIERNYAVNGAREEHKVFSAVSRYALPLSGSRRFENTLGYAYDNHESIRSFPGEVLGDTLVSEGVSIEPHETTWYEDMRLLTQFEAGGRHDAVLGAALTWGRTTAEGIGFDFDQLLSQYPSIPAVGDIPVGDVRSFEDRRTFFGIYAHDAWTPQWRMTLSGGARYDATSEKLHAQAQEQAPGEPLEVADDSRRDNAFSGDVSLLYRLIPEGGTGLQAANLYGSWRSAFKPAAPNLSEAEGAEILEPERTNSWEFGAKIRALSELMLNLSYFDMMFENMVVSILGSGGESELTNAGEQRFKGEEVDLGWQPAFARGASVQLGYAHHDARFVDFTFVTPEGEPRDVSGNMLELVPRHLLNAKLAYSSSFGPGAFVAVRYQGERPLNRRNSVFTEAYTEWDAGASWQRGPWLLSLVGRNLGDDRHLTTESEIGDSQFYVAAPRRVHFEATYHF